MGPSSELLLEFLGRPRTVEEVAERFGISPSEAKRLVIQAVESGQLLVSSRPRGKPQGSSLRVSRVRSDSIPLSNTLAAAKSKLFQVNTSRVASKISVAGGGELLFKLRRGGPSSISRVSRPFTASSLLRGDSSTARKDNRISLSIEIQLLESLDTGPKKLDYLRGSFGVHRATLEGLVRKGLISSRWGTKGVGNFYGITSIGKRELQRLKTASTIDKGIAERKLISLKVASSQPIS